MDDRVHRARVTARRCDASDGIRRTASASIVACGDAAPDDASVMFFASPKYTHFADVGDAYRLLQNR